MTFTYCSLTLTALQKKPEEINRRSSDMWSFAVLLWELVTREVPFADLSNMEIGMKVRRANCSLDHKLSNKSLYSLLIFSSVSSQQNLLLYFWPSGRLGGFEAHYPARHLAPHLQAHEDMHERRSSEEAQIWHDCANSGKNAGQVKKNKLFCPPILNRQITGYLTPDITLIWWCGAYQYCLKLLLYRRIQRHCSFWDEFSSSLFILFFVFFFLCDITFLFVSSFLSLIHPSQEVSIDCSSS